jgi:hypothetical protein
MRGLLTGSKNLVGRVNIFKLIGDMERNQQLADHLEYLNEELSEEAQRKDLCREAHAACTKEIRNHLVAFLEERQQRDDRQHRQERGCGHSEEENDTVYYETWISELHPDNLMFSQPLGKDNKDHDDDNDACKNGRKNKNGTHLMIDPRFYVKESDHRLIWNEQMRTLAAQNDDPDNKTTALDRIVEPLIA